jgi:hypothetical protein
MLSVAQLRIAVTEAKGQFGIPEEWEHLPFEADTKGMVKIQLTEKIMCVL